MATCQDHTSHNSSIDGVDDLQMTFIEELLAVVRGWERKHRFSSRPWPMLLFLSSSGFPASPYSPPQKHMGNTNWTE